MGDRAMYLPADSSTCTGFTIVELVTVMILLGILSVAAVSRMVSPSDFAPGIVSSSATAQVRYARGLAMSREDTSVSFEVALSGSDWMLRTLTTSEGEVRRESVERGGTSLVISNGGTNVTLSSTVGLMLNFDSIGNLNAASAGATVMDPSLGLVFTISGDSVRQLCLYPTGYVLDGTCV